MTTNSIIVDSSVIAKWFFPDEETSESALKIKQDFIQKSLSIYIPPLIFYEVNNLIKTAIKSLRINKKKAFTAYNGFLNLNFIVYFPKKLLEATLERAVNLDLSSYDATYVALSK